MTTRSALFGILAISVAISSASIASSQSVDSSELHWEYRSLRLPEIQLQPEHAGSDQYTLKVIGPIELRSRRTGISRLSELHGRATRDCESLCTLTLRLEADNMTISTLRAGSAVLRLTVPIESGMAVSTWLDRHATSDSPVGLPTGTVLDLKQSWSNGGMRVVLRHEGLNHWRGQASFGNYPVMFTVLQELAGCDSIAEGGALYRRLDSAGLVAHPTEGISRIDFSLAGTDGVVWSGASESQSFACRG
ncbi:hypothetical protein J7355_13150 [Endozoicomonas sp. G2_2]|uniref:hypothetical protein n=1 Tax=Endozoicomonas sp. G2_2 TaxID=2821092 RepID=UPI001ADAE7E1|nr:hypothetical protein [Endozoicomonas sp. G2_2]MBO9471041.1 hypothetical protein [Endozoicomonas sp. G2_2]